MNKVKYPKANAQDIRNIEWAISQGLDITKANEWFAILSEETISLEDIDTDHEFKYYTEGTSYHGHEKKSIASGCYQTPKRYPEESNDK